MKRKITRRTFVQRGLDAGAAALVGGTLLPQLGCKEKIEVNAPPSSEMAWAEGDDRKAATIEAVEHLGGMGRFVPRGAKVCLLANAQRDNPGTYTHPEILRVTVAMCKKAKALKVDCISWLPKSSWEATGLAQAAHESGAELKIVDLKDESLFRPMPVPKGVILKEARIMELFFDYDVFINMPITKDHMGNRFTGSLKNLMGLNSPKTNRTFHTGNFTNDNIEHLDQCIADLNTVVQPTLNIVDATEFIITNGPFGPGKLHKPRKVVAGTDRVAVDAYCCSLWGLKPEEIIMIQRAHGHGLGEMVWTKKM